MVKKQLRKFLFPSLFVCFVACKPTLNKVAVNPLTHGGYGYTIYYQGKKFITQQNIPAINRNIGFQTRSDARKVGMLVMRRIVQKPAEFPDVTIQELDSLKIRY